MDVVVGREHLAVTELVSRLRGPFAEHVAKLNLGALVDEVERINADFGERLHGPADVLEYSEVEAAQVAAEDAFHRLIIQVMYDYMDDLGRLNTVLAPLFSQEARMKRYFKRRGTMPEIDPATGEPLDEGVQPGGDAPGDDVVEPATDDVVEPA